MTPHPHGSESLLHPRTVQTAGCTSSVQARPLDSLRLLHRLEITQGTSADPAVAFGVVGHVRAAVPKAWFGGCASREDNRRVPSMEAAVTDEMNSSATVADDPDVLVGLAGWRELLQREHYIRGSHPDPSTPLGDRARRPVRPDVVRPARPRSTPSRSALSVAAASPGH
jgi:hypothetical protein